MGGVVLSSLLLWVPYLYKSQLVCRKSGTWKVFILTQAHARGFTYWFWFLYDWYGEQFIGTALKRDIWVTSVTSIIVIDLEMFEVVSRKPRTSDVIQPKFWGNNQTIISSQLKRVKSVYRTVPWERLELIEISYIGYQFKLFSLEVDSEGSAMQSRIHR